MTLDEFQQRIQAVSDRRLQRMLEKARVEGPDEAVLMLEKEQDRRNPPKPPNLAQLDLSSQIRPLEEVLGQSFDFHEMPAKPASFSHAGREIVGPVKENSGKTEFISWQPVSTEAPSLQILRDVMERPSNEPLTADHLVATSAHPASQVAQVSHVEEAQELMAPLVLTLPEKAVETQPFEPKSLSRPTPGDRGRAFAVIAIILLVVAAGLAVWRALVG